MAFLMMQIIVVRFPILFRRTATAKETFGEFVRCVSNLANDWKEAGLITGAQKGAIMSCAAHASIP
jgi:hypothetical protein